MTELDDNALLAEFARSESGTAFATLVARHVNLVYSAALRFSGNPHHAEEITQAVFVILARKAGSLRRGVVLSGWLYQTARLTAANFMKGEIRRQQREQEAYMQSTLNEPEAAAWRQMAPLLDEAMGGLGETDRNAVVLRYFENKTAAEVARALNLTEAAAHKRVNRALEKLRKIFARRGVTLTAVLIGGASACSVQAAPPGVAAAVTRMAVGGTSISATITTLVKGTMKTMTWLKLKFAIGAAAVVLLAGGVATIAISGDAQSTPSPLQFRLVLDAASADTETVTEMITNSANGNVFKNVLKVQKKGLLDGAAIASASVFTNAMGGREIEFVMTPKGRKQFAKVTRENIGRKLAIFVDGKVVSAPVIQAEITEGKGEIAGNFSEAEATDLAVRINRAAGK